MKKIKVMINLNAAKSYCRPGMRWITMSKQSTNNRSNYSISYAKILPLAKLRRIDDDV